MHNAFKLALFMPQIVSNIVMCLMFRYMTSNVYSGLVNLFTGETVTGLLNNTETAFTTLIVFQVWVGFGTNVLLFSGAMSGINESVLEAGKIDGASPFKEFTNIVFPLTFPTLTVFITLMLANLFTNQLSLFSFYGSENAETEFWTMGYYLYHETIKARSGGGANYPYISALGLLITLFIAPITFGIDTLLKKYGPSVD
jgi:ABC-type sugar transport system permease subunit